MWSSFRVPDILFAQVWRSDLHPSWTGVDTQQHGPPVFLCPHWISSGWLNLPTYPLLQQLSHYHLEYTQKLHGRTECQPLHFIAPLPRSVARGYFLFLGRRGRNVRWIFCILDQECCLGFPQWCMQVHCLWCQVEIDRWCWLSQWCTSYHPQSSASSARKWFRSLVSHWSFPIAWAHRTRCNPWCSGWMRVVHEGICLLCW